MEQVIYNNFVEKEFENLAIAQLGHAGTDLNTNSEMDEGSDAEGPMVTQASEVSTVDSIVQLSRNMVALAEARRGLNRTRGSDQDA